MIGLISAALAGPGDANYTATPLNADPFRPALSGTMAVESVALPARFVVRADLTSTRNLLIWIGEDDTRYNLLEQVTTLHLGASWRVGERGALSIGAPLHLLLSSDTFTTPAALAGDLALGARIQLLPWLGGIAGVSFPLGAVQYQLGYPGSSLDLGLLLQAPLGPVTALLSSGLRAQPESTLRTPDGDLTLGDHLWYRAGLLWPLRPSLDLSGALLGRYTPGAAIAGAPLEAMVEAQHRSETGALFRCGLGAGIIEGIGAPTWRLLVGVGYDPDAAPAQ